MAVAIGRVVLVVFQGGLCAMIPRGESHAFQVLTFSGRTKGHQPCKLINKHRKLQCRESEVSVSAQAEPYLSRDQAGCRSYRFVVAWRLSLNSPAQLLDASISALFLSFPDPFEL
jgi:hypothetical protein